MICGLEEMRRKEVIDIKTGERLGYIDDIQINIETSEVMALVIYGRMGIFGILGKEEDVVIQCSEIKVIGSDIILIEREENKIPSYTTNKKRFSLQSLFR